MAALLALISSGMWGVADYLGGRLTRTRSVGVVVGLSQGVGLIVMLVLATITAAWAAPLGYLGWAVLASLSGACGLLLYYRALAMGPMGVVSPIASLGVLVPLVVGFWQGDRLTVAQGAGIAIALLGVVLASGPEVSGEVGIVPVLMAGGAALLLGTSMVAIAQGSEVSVIMTMTAMRAVTVGLLGLAVLIARPRVEVGRADVPALIVVGVFDVGANLTFGAASTMGMLMLVAVFGSLYPVVTLLLARWLDGERLRRIQQVGVALAVGGAIAISAG